MALAAVSGKLNPMASSGLGETSSDRATIASVTGSPSGSASSAGRAPGARKPDEGTHAPQAGDWIEVDATGEGSPRCGLILEILGEGRHTHFRVRWDEEHVSLFYPAERGFLVRRGAIGTGGQ
jgi:hypothetical protein